MSRRLREWRLSRAQEARAEKPAAPPDPAEKFAKDAHDLAAVRKSVEDAASVSAGLWLSYLFALLYIGIAAGAVTHHDLLLDSPVKLPFLSVDLPLVAFFFLAPILFIDESAPYVMHGLIAHDRITDTGALPPGLVDAILDPKCPVSAALTEPYKAALIEIAKEASGAH